MACGQPIQPLPPHALPTQTAPALPPVPPPPGPAPSGPPPGAHQPVGDPGRPGGPPPPSAPPPAGWPAPTAPSFLARTLAGDWASSVAAAAWGPIVICALTLASRISLADAFGEEPLGWGESFQITLAILLQGVGGSLEATIPGANDGTFADSAAESVITLSVSAVPLTVTVLFLAAGWLGARLVRSSIDSGTAAVEATVRTALLSGGLVLLLALFAQPEWDGTEVSISPLRAALGALLMSALVTLPVLARPWWTEWARSRPGALTALRALRAALVGCAAVLALSAVVVWIVLIVTEDWADVPFWTILLLVLLTPNLAAVALGFAWGAPLEYTDTGFLVALDGTSLSLTDLGDASGGWAVTGTVAGGVVCALLLGGSATWLTRRHPPGQFLSAATSIGILLCAVWLAGLSAEATERKQTSGWDGSAPVTEESARQEIGSAFEVVPLTVVWVLGGVLLVSLATRAFRAAGSAGPPPPAFPGGPPGYLPGPGFAPHPVPPTLPATPAPPGGAGDGPLPAQRAAGAGPLPPESPPRPEPESPPEPVSPPEAESLPEPDTEPGPESPRKPGTPPEPGSAPDQRTE